MLYSHHIHDPGGEPFVVVVNDDTMTWASEPAGRTISKPRLLYFTHGGRRGSGRNFTIFPGGRAEARPMIGDDF
ncbi:MAG: hypothetical protein ACLQPV_04935 [Vulcanimicrobiaceae bacterium]